MHLKTEWICPGLACASLWVCVCVSMNTRVCVCVWESQTKATQVLQTSCGNWIAANCNTDSNNRGIINAPPRAADEIKPAYLFVRVGEGFS